MLIFLSILLTLLPLLPLLPYAHWSVRVFDFIRLQTLVFQAILAILLILQNLWNGASVIVLTGLLLSISFQLFRIYPYTIFHKRVRPKGIFDSKKLKLVVANVLQTNTAYPLFIKEIKRLIPDVFITMESDALWDNAISKELEEYVYTTKVTLSNFYGMHLYSKIPIVSSQISYLVEGDIPSIESIIHINNQDIRLIAIHPAPPSPTENETSKERDAELMLVAKMCRASTISTIVCGDLNDVVWSKTSRLFTKITGFLDPRIGRGFYATFHANYWFFRFPLDHLFHSKDLHVPRLKRLRPFGSDHFGMYYEIMTPLLPKDVLNPSLSPLDKEEINNIIEEGTS